MQQSKTKRRTFDSEFKRQAVRLVIEDGKSCRTVERDLGLSEGTVYKWVQNAREDPENCFLGKGHVRASDAEVHRLLNENDHLRRERDILKKALAIFSQKPLRNTFS